VDGAGPPARTQPLSDSPVERQSRSSAWAVSSCNYQFVTDSLSSTLPSRRLIGRAAHDICQRDSSDHGVPGDSVAAIEERRVLILGLTYTPKQSNHRQVSPLVTDPDAGDSVVLQLGRFLGGFVKVPVCEDAVYVPTYWCEQCGWKGTWFRVDAVRAHHQECPGCRGALRLAFTEIVPFPPAARAGDTRGEEPDRRGDANASNNPHQ
jgi:hypothetical protein